MSNTTLHEVKSTASSSYVAHYHMTREPFGATVENDLYYAEASRKQKLDILLHLTQYGNELVLVVGPAGSGKTTLLQQYLVNSLDAWVVARVDAQGGIDERKLLQQLFRHMGMDFHGATHSELFERMQHHFDALQHSARQAVLLIDNAEQLPVTALKRVLEMAALTSADNKPLLRIILFATDKLDNNFGDPLLDPQPAVVRRNVSLLPFSADQTAHYILHRLTAANFSSDKPFTDAVMQKIHKQSKGWPGEINQLAHIVLIETQPTAGAILDNLPSFNKTRAMAVLSGIFILSVLFYFQDEFKTELNLPPSDVAEQVTRNLPVVPPPSELQTAVATTETVITHDATSTPETMTTETDENVTTPIIESTESIIPKMPIIANAEELQQAVPVAEAPVVTKTPDVNTQRVSVTSEPAKKPLPSIPDDLPGFRHTWILDQNPAHYTLQMVAGNNLKTLRSFIRRYPPAGPLAIYRTTRKGIPWFGLIQQIYPNKQAAIKARDLLPAALRKQNPWVRRFADLQKDLVKTR